LTRNYGAAAEALDRAIALDPNSWDFEFHRAALQMYWKGDLSGFKRLHSPAGNTPDELHTEDRFLAKLLLREYDEAERILRDDPHESFSNGNRLGVPQSLLVCMIIL